MKPHTELVVCRCGQEFEDTIDWDHLDICPYEQCDDPTCKALKVPGTLEEYQAAYLHWKRHQYLCGCSHGR